MKTPHLVFACSLLVLSACKKDEAELPQENNPAEPIVQAFLFEDGFEDATVLTDLFPQDNSRWTTIQQVDPEGNTNEIGLSSEQASEESQALKLVSYAGENPLSKLDIEKQGFQALIGQRIVMSADFYIEGSGNLQNLLLMDLESCSIWDPDVPNNQCPGVRLQMSGGNDFLSIERGKIGNPIINQNQVPFPRNQWVSVEWEMLLSDEDDTAQNILRINGTEVINTTGKNMPNQAEFAQIAAEQGIENFQLQTPLNYERFQIGATANASPSDVVMYVDNVRLEILVE